MQTPYLKKLVFDLYIHLIDEPELNKEDKELLEVLKKQPSIATVINEVELEVVSETDKKSIQQVQINTTTTLYINNYNADTMELSFRVTPDISIVHTKPIVINEAYVFIDNFKFPIIFLNQFILINAKHYEQLIETATREHD